MARKLGLSIIVAVMVVLCLTPPAQAASFQLGGHNYLKAQSEGQINPYWSPVIHTDPSDAALMGMVGTEVGRFSIADIFGVHWSSLSDGMTRSGFDYVLPYQFVVSTDTSLDGKQAKNTSGYQVEFSGAIHLTSIELNNESIRFSGYLDGMYVNPATASSVLSTIAGSSNPSFDMLVTLSSSAEINFIQALNSSTGSAFGDMRITIGGSMAATPEPGTIVLLGSALLGSGLLRRRRKEQEA